MTTPTSATTTTPPSATTTTPTSATTTRHLMTPRQEVRIAAWNVRTGHQVGQKETIACELQQCKVGVAALSELRLTGSGTTVIQLPDSDEYTTLYYSRGTNNLVVGNSLFQHPWKHQVTWRAPNGKDTSVLDYILINKRFRSFLKDVRSMRSADCGSDHHLVCTRVQLKLAKANVTKSGRKSTARRDWQKLLEPTQAQQFQLALSNRFQALQDLDSSDVKLDTASDTIKKVDETFANSEAERLLRWQEYFQQLLNHPAPQELPATPLALQQPTKPAQDKPPTLLEVIQNIKALKNGKAPGPDEVVAESLKAGGQILAERLHQLILTIWNTGVIPSAWKKALIIPIHKKGDKQDCSNYRGISLLSITGEVFMQILQNRLQEHHEQLAREEQAGFRPTRGYCDQIFTLRQVMEERSWCGLRTALNRHQGVQLGEADFITDLAYADDSAIFANNDAEATDILNAVAHAARPYGLHINVGKTKVLTTDGTTAIVYLDGELVEQVPEFRLSIAEAREKAQDQDCRAWRQLTTAGPQQQRTPTAAYWLQGQPRPAAS
uniref:Reverse transcriptase domain-containing protein n=1 Tax=Plectus sambesii TaxID=2011161 RepID=A0A914X3Y7_9BILA